MTDIYELIKDEESLSFIGMCKNAGKTTALNYIINELHKRGICAALTSIGRDGEELDLVTNTKKPEIYIYKDSYIATAKELIQYCDITKEIAESTGIYTPLGEIIIIRALSDGFIQIAGPSLATQMAKLSESFRKFCSGKILIDGALERKSIATRKISDATILSTGASYSADMEKVIDDTLYTVMLFSLPEYDLILPDDFDREKYCDKYYGIDGSRLDFDCAGSDLKEIWAGDGNVENVFVNGALTDTMVSPLLFSNTKLDGKRLVLLDGSRILMKPESFNKLRYRGLDFACLESINIIAITINPFSAYGNHFDANLFLYNMQKRTNLPVINIADRG